jgi:chromosome segregation ATPase
MKRWKESAILLLALLSAYVGFACRERQGAIKTLEEQIQQLQAELARQSTQRAELEKRISEAQQQVVTLQNAAATASSESTSTPSDAKKLSPPLATVTPLSSDIDKTTQWLADANNSDVMRRLSTQARNQTLRHYDDFLKELNLSPGENEQLVKLLIEKKQAAIDVAAASFQQGEDPRNDPATYKAAVVATKEKIEDEIQSLLGDDNYARYINFDRSTGQNNVVSNLSSVLRNTETPLNAGQQELLRQSLQQHETGRITAKVIADSKSFLTPEQILALQDLRAVQQANSDKRNAPTQILPTATTPPDKKPKSPQ